MKCRICDFEDKTFAQRLSVCRFNGKAIKRYECSACGVIFGPLNMIDLSPEVLTDEYIALYESYSEADTTRSEIEVFRTLAPKRDGKYLDYGSGKNRAVETLRDEGYEVYSYDLIGKDHFAMDDPFVFDGIFSHNVIEHLQNPVETFKFLTSKLVPRGRMSHGTPCYNYTCEDTRFHLFFFCGKALDVLCIKAGLQIVDKIGNTCVFEKMS